MLAELLCVAIGMVSTDYGGKLLSSRASLACKMMPHVISESNKNKIRPTLVLAMIHVESGWDKKAISPSGACGLTQVVPKWTGSAGTRVPKLTCNQLHNPHTSITMGTRLLSFWIKNYGLGNEQVGLCGYNKGYRCKGKRPHKRGMKYARLVLAVERLILKQLELVQHERNTPKKSIQY